MNVSPKILFAVTGLFIAALPPSGFAQQSQFSSTFATTSEICTGGNGGPTNRSNCFQSLLPLLSDVRSSTAGAQYDSEIAAVALSIVTGYTDLASPPIAVCAVIADALAEVGRSAADPDQSGQILAIADRVRACSGLNSGIERLLASPN